MANFKNFGIAGVSSDVQYGKSNGRLIYSGGLFKFTDSGGSTLVKLQSADPTGSTDVATKAYVDATKQGLDPKDSVRVATTAAGTLATSFANGSTVDGITLATGDRILIKNQVTGAENGLYDVAASGAPARSSDADAATGEFDGGAFVFVEEGTTNADSGWVMTNDGTVTIGTTALTFTQFSGAGQITAGSGMTKSGNTLNVIAGTGITANANDIQISASYAGQGTITTLGTIATGVWNGTAIPSQYGGTGANLSGSTGALIVDGGTVTASATLAVAKGGTGAATFTNNRVLTGNGTSALVDEANLTFDGTTLDAPAVTVDNLKLDASSLTSTNANGDINLTPNGSGQVVISKADINSGTFDGIVGGTTPADGSFTTASTSGQATLATVDINGGAIDGAVIGGATPAAGTFTTAIANTSLSTDLINEKTAANGVVIDGIKLKDSIVYSDTIAEKTSANGVQIDGATIKDNTFLGNVTVEASETLNVSAGTLTLANDQISGDKIHGGTISGSPTIAGTLSGTFTGDANVSAGTLTLAANQISGDKLHGGTFSDFTSTGINDDGTGNALTISSSNNVTITNDLIVAGDLTVSGDNVVINTSKLTVEDPLTILSSGATGAASVDSGLVIERGTDVNVGMVWDESEDEFGFITTTETGDTAGNVTITDYADARMGGLVVDDDITAKGDLDFTTAADITLLDNSAVALEIKEAGNAYLTFNTANSGGEKITLGKPLEGGAVAISGTAFDINGGAIDGAVIGAASAAAITGTVITASTNFAGALTGDVTGNADTATALATARTIGGTSFNGTANIVPGTITVADTTDTTTFVSLWESATGDLAPKSDAGLTYNAGTAALTAATFVGALTGNVTGTVSGNAGTVTNGVYTIGNQTIGGTKTFSSSIVGNLTGDVTGNADTATVLATARTIGGVSFNGSANIVPSTITVADTTDTTTFVGLWESATGALAPKSDGALLYNAGTGALTAGSYVGTWAGTALTDAQVANNLTIAGGTVNTTVIGGTGAAAGTFTDFTSVGILDVASTGNALTLDGDNDVVVTNNLDVGGAVTITGNLTVNGTTTSVSTVNTTIEDNVIMLNQGETGASITETFAGISVDRGTSANAHMVYDDGQDRWEMLSGHDTIATAALSAIAFGTVGAGTWQGTAVGGAYGGTGISTAGTTGVARLDSGTWSIANASLTADVDGVLPVANGGTAATSLDDIVAGSNKISVSGGADTIIGGNASLDVVEANLTLSNLGGNIALASQVSGSLPIANGGTALTAAGAANTVLTSNGTVWSMALPTKLFNSSGVETLTATGATTSGAGEGIAITNAGSRVNVRAKNTAGSGDVDLYIGGQGNGVVTIEGSGSGILQGNNDEDLQVRGGAASSGAAGDLILKGGAGTGGHASGNVYIQGGSGGASEGDVEIRDSAGLEVQKWTGNSNAVNEVTVSNAATSNSPTIAATGNDTNISLLLNPKGTGVINVPASYKDRAGFGTNSLATKEYVDLVSSTETYARRASFTANSSLQNYNIGAVLVTGTTLYVNKVVVSVTTALSGGSIAGVRLHDGTAYLTALDDCDTTAVGTYVIDLPTTTSTASAAQLNVKMVQSNGTTAATPTAGVVVTTAQYVKV